MYYLNYQEFYLTSEAKHFLVSIQKPLAIITITGIYQTGKSYLVNKLIKNRHNGFKIGSNS
jgi:predicted AAA+ superfamily ATPase